MHLPRTAAVVGAAGLLVAGVQLGAVASSGHPLLLGHVNRSDKTTTIKSTKGKPALRLKTKAGVAPLTVTSRTKVTRLNADTVDGQDATELGTHAFTYALPSGGTASTSHVVKFPGLPGGQYMVSYSIYGNGATDLTCYLRADTSTPTAGRIALSDSPRNAVSASDVLVVPPAPQLPEYLRCGSSSPFNFGFQDPTAPGQQQSTVTFVAIGSVTDGTPTVS